MTVPPSERRAWRCASQGLAFARRGIALTAASGLLILVLGAAGRAGCANPALPEVRSLMDYQDLVFHAALWLGFTLVVGGLLWASRLPGTPGERLIPAGTGALAGVALLLTTHVATPGRLPLLDAPPRDAGPLIAAVVGTAALAASVLPAMLVARRLGAARLVRAAAWFGPALLVTAAANAEAASGLIWPEPLPALYALGGIAAVNAAAGYWLLRILGEAEALIGRHLAPPDATAEAAAGAEPSNRAKPSDRAEPSAERATPALIEDP